MSTAFAMHVDQRPRLRGASHLAAFFVFLAVNLWLLFTVDGSARLAVGVYALSHAFLFGVSATFHRRTWSRRGFRRMRALDHCAVFVLIAGSYTPLFMLLGGEQAATPLVVVWSLAGLGIAKAIVWTNGPAWVNSLLAIGVGWAGAGPASALVPVMGVATFSVLIASGVVYTLGGVVYATKRPDPVPEVFGYHEVFHACVIAGGVVHYAHTLMVLRAAGAL